ncbi:MAG: DUF938 domain-containing protein [Pseudomonadota bacterium]
MKFNTNQADGRRSAPAAQRNTAPLIEALEKRLPDVGHVLEVASGTGQHVAAFAAAFPNLQWQPSDVDPEQRQSIEAWRLASGLTNIHPPLPLDVSAPWPVTSGPVCPGSAHAVLTINLLHLVPEPHVASLFAGARQVLAPVGQGDRTAPGDRAGRVIIYGPFLRGTDYASEGDRAFDTSLRAQHPAIGYKSVEAVSEMAIQAGFEAVAIDRMPANNLLLTFALP